MARSFLYHLSTFGNIKRFRLHISHPHDLILVSQDPIQNIFEINISNAHFLPILVQQYFSLLLLLCGEDRPFLIVVYLIIGLFPSIDVLLPLALHKMMRVL